MGLGIGLGLKLGLGLRFFTVLWLRARDLRHCGTGLTTTIYPTASGLRGMEETGRTLPITRARHTYLKVVREKA